MNSRPLAGTGFLVLLALIFIIALILLMGGLGPAKAGTGVDGGQSANTIESGHVQRDARTPGN